MRSPDGRDMFFALAGLVWGTVTLYRGLVAWRESRAHDHAAGSSCALGSVSLVRARVPSSMISGAGILIGCAWYLLWRFI